MGYNPFDFLGTYKRKRVSSKSMSMAKDDLQVIKGFGPFIEENLNALGIYMFVQIARMTPELEEEVITESLIHFSEEVVEIADIEEATVAIAVDALEVEIEVEQGQQVAVQFVPEPPPVVEAGQPEPVVEAPAMLDISIADNTGELLAEVEVDLTPFRVEDRQEETELEEEPEPAPIVLAISFDEEIGEVEQVEESIEAWVASDAEYFQAIIEDRVEEVLGETWVEQLEETDDWEIEEEFEEFDLTEILLAVEEDYWEDDIW